MRQCNALLRRVWRFIIALCAGFVFAVAAVPKPAAVPSAPGSAVGADPLTEVVSDINLDYPTYGEAFAWLRQHSHANLFVNWKALKRIGVTPETRLETELKLHDISL